MDLFLAKTFARCYPFMRSNVHLRRKANRSGYPGKTRQRLELIRRIEWRGGDL